jgi:hypothetical protein
LTVSGPGNYQDVKTKEGAAPLRSALEIALERQERYEDLSSVMAEISEHILLLEECWNSIAARPNPVLAEAPEHHQLAA